MCCYYYWPAFCADAMSHLRVSDMYMKKWTPTTFTWTGQLIDHLLRKRYEICTVLYYWQRWRRYSRDKDQSQDISTRLRVVSSRPN